MGTTWTMVWAQQWGRGTELDPWEDGGTLGCGFPEISRFGVAPRLCCWRLREPQSDFHQVWLVCQVWPVWGKGNLAMVIHALVASVCSGWGWPWAWSEGSSWSKRLDC